MIKVTYDTLDAPSIAEEIDNIIKNLHNPDDYVLSLQLDYRDHNTIFYLKKVTEINFKENLLEIVQYNNSHAFFTYQSILEYCIINAQDIINLGEGII